MAPITERLVSSPPICRRLTTSKGKQLVAATMPAIAPICACRTHACTHVLVHVHVHVHVACGMCMWHVACACACPHRLRQRDGDTFGVDSLGQPPPQHVVRRELHATKGDDAGDGGWQPEVQRSDAFLLADVGEARHDASSCRGHRVERDPHAYLHAQTGGGIGDLGAGTGAPPQPHLGTPKRRGRCSRAQRAAPSRRVGLWSGGQPHGWCEPGHL